MSTRYLRKVLKQQEQNQFQTESGVTNDEEEGEELDQIESEFGAHLKNPFDLLNVDDDEDHDMEQEFEQDVIEVASEDKADEPKSLKGENNGFSTSSKKSKKKKKAKKVTSLINNSVGESLELVLEKLSLDGKSGNKNASFSETNTTAKIHAKLSMQSKQSFLKTDPKFLNAASELRRIFGSEVVKSFENSSQAGSSRQVRGKRRGSYAQRKSVLISPSDHWPRWDEYLSMELIETRDGISIFRYVHSSSYRKSQRAFEAAKEIHDLNGVASILMHYPYHMESLITLAEYFKLLGLQQMAAESVAKCLYALECAWHPVFRPVQGDCRLEYTHKTNRPLFITLFIHMLNLDRRGCHRSALEVCKLLLSLDPTDPVGALFCVDYFAVRAGEYAWLERFSEESHCDNYIWHFPNIAFSLAICRFFLEREEHGGSSENGEFQNQKEASIDLMKQALMLHPPVLVRLVDKVPLTDQAWKNILKHAFFKSKDTGIPSVDHLIRIYVERSYIIWRLPNVQKVLKDAALSVIEDLARDGSEAKAWASDRKQAFPSDKNEYKHLLVSDFSHTVAMPPENLQDFMIDPRMQEMMANQNQNPEQGAPRQQGAPPQQGSPRQQGHASRELANRSPFLRVRTRGHLLC